MLASGQSEEAVARWGSEQRNNLKLVYRDPTPPDKLAEYQARDVRKYGNPPGPSADQLQAQGKSLAEIVDDARAGGKEFDFPPPGW